MNNSALTSTTILNFAEMAQRRMIYSIGVTYDTSVNQMKAIPSMIEDIINQQEHSTFNRCHFTEFADSSLNFELVYYIDTRDYTVALNEQQAINIGIMEASPKKGSTSAFPAKPFIWRAFLVKASELLEENRASPQAATPRSRLRPRESTGVALIHASALCIARFFRRDGKRLLSTTVAKGAAHPALFQ